jgi:hypothetical protein
MRKAIENASGGQVLSCIINQVCPECGGYMVAFHCQGQCRRDWREEWDRLSNAPVSSHHARKKACVENEL